MSEKLGPQIEQNRNLLGISNTYMRGQEALAHVTPDLEPLVNGVEDIVIVPYALLERDYVTDVIGIALTKMGARSFRSTHQHPGSEREMLEDARVIYIGGGNTGRLVANLHGLQHFDGSFVDPSKDASQHSLVKKIREKAANGTPVVGSSAGVNVMCKDVRCTNDMQAAVQLKAGGERVLRIDALGLLPEYLSINPHYQERVVLSEEERLAALAVNAKLAQLIDHQGESRDDRIAQILEMDNRRIVLALREGAYIVVKGMEMRLKGKSSGVVFEYGMPVGQHVSKGADISVLLDPETAHDPYFAETGRMIDDLGRLRMGRYFNWTKPEEQD